MGSMIDAACSCGYTSMPLLGGGMDNFLRECPIPFHCPSCRAVVTADLLAKAPACPDCGQSGIVPYTDPSLAGDPGTLEVADCKYFSQDGGGRVSLSNGTYLCPSCERTTLQFSFAGCYD
jgi:Zn finger protein HypA/HybF involved in hydrogenase expression